MPRFPGRTAALLGVTLLTGCAMHHPVAFQQLRDPITTRSYPDGLVAVVSPETLAQKVEIRSLLAGAGQRWDVEPGVMLRQVADAELPQMFRYYRLASAYAVPAKGRRRMILVLTVPRYAFAHFHATITVHANAYGHGHRLLFSHDYTASGTSQGAKMYWAGAFGMKSALRQSSLDAYHQIFQRLRGDLARFSGP